MSSAADDLNAMPSAPCEGRDIISRLALRTPCTPSDDALPRRAAAPPVLKAAWRLNSMQCRMGRRFSQSRRLFLRSPGLIGCMKMRSPSLLPRRDPIGTRPALTTSQWGLAHIPFPGHGRPVHDIRREFEKSQNALGPIAGSALNAATYAVPGMGLGKAANIAKGAWKVGGLAASTSSHGWL